MGEKGGPFTEADNYIAARYLASFPDFEGATSRERWGPFHDKVIHNLGLSNNFTQFIFL